MKNILGFDIIIEDNNSYAYHRCSYTKYCSCGCILNKWNTIPKDLMVKKRKFDLSGTYDGVVIASTKFKKIYDEYKFQGLIFNILPADQDFYYIRSVREIEFDYNKRETRFIDKCKICNQFAQVAGVSPVCLVNNYEIPRNEFVRSDIEFGSYFEKHPILMCGANVGSALEKEKLKGITLVEIKPIP